MEGLLEKLTVFNTDVDSDTTIGDAVIPTNDVTALRVTIELDSLASFAVEVTPPNEAAMANSFFNKGDAIEANAIRTFTFSVRSGAEYRFRHLFGAAAKVKQCLVEEVRGGVI